MEILTWEAISIVASVVASTIAVLARLNHVENDYQAGRAKLKDLENQYMKVSKTLEVQEKELQRLKAQLSREFNNIAWQLKIIIGTLKDIENFLERNGYTKGTRGEILEEEDTRGFMLRKIRELDSEE